MTPGDLEARLAGRPNSTTVAAVVAELRADPDWSVTDLRLAGQPEVMELRHHPSAATYTLRRWRVHVLQRTQGG
jgi:hypothetical protein